ncbi:MAG: zinc-ribbon domain-containing protein, partial [Desulfobacterales bacterium]|nr:zinc-ribbon domain-containing protein [Desulfobacterales bacterium]
MIVTCENCNTGFNLDENLIKESGSKVRCSKCHHIFTAYKPVPVEEPEPALEPEEAPPEIPESAEAPLASLEAEEAPEEALDFDLSEEAEEKPAEEEIALEALGLEE